MDQGKEVEEGSHAELLRIPVLKEEEKKDADGKAEPAKVITGFYHNM